VLLTWGGLIGACGDDEATPPPTSVDAGVDATPLDATVADSSHTGHDSATPGPLLRCTDADLAAPCAEPLGGSCLTRTEVEITFNTGAAPDPYVNRCLTVRVGTTVVFSGNFFQHPLEPAGGDTPTPIPKLQPKTAADNPPAGDAGRPETRLTLTTPGTFGYQCTYHPVQMYGAIRVLP